MILQIKSHPWDCLVTSFAMALQLPVSTLVEMIGHGGGDIIFPYEPEPMCRRGFHVQECIVQALALGYCVTPVQLFPTLTCETGYATHPVIYGAEANNWGQFIHFIRTTSGVIEGHGRRCNHAVAYDRGRIFDPDGREYDYSNEACAARGFYTTCLWRVDRREDAR